MVALIWLGMWTGARIEELCALRLAEVSHDRLKIVGAKTAAGNRDIPIHDSLKPMVRALKERSTDGYLISGLTFSKHGDRSTMISKRFGGLKKRMGFGPDLVFHSIRKTVATRLKSAGVPEEVAADILGHELPTISYGLYAGSVDFEVKQEAIARLRYDVEEPILFGSKSLHSINVDSPT